MLAKWIIRVMRLLLLGLLGTGTCHHEGHDRDRSSCNDARHTNRDRESSNTRESLARSWWAS